MAGELDSGGGGGGGSFDDGSTDDTSGGTPTSGYSVLLPDWLTQIKPVLTAFGNSPTGFVLGIALSTVLNGVESIVTALLDAVLFIFIGDGPGLEGGLGLADLPLLVGSILVDATRGLGLDIISGASAFTGALIDLSSSFGPLAPVALAVMVSGIGIAVAWVARLALEIVLDAIPGGGALIN